MAGPDEGAGSQAATLRRGISLLNALSTLDGARCCGTVSQLARTLDTHKSQVSRNLSVLTDLGLVERCPDHRGYLLTWALYRIGVRSHRHWLVEAAAEPLQWLARRVRLSAYLVIRSESGVYPLWSVSPDDRTPFSPPGQRWSLHASAAGTALLMGYDREAFFEEFADARFHQFTANTPTTAEQLWERVRRAKQLGYAIQIGEWDPELGAIAVPVVSSFENLAVAVSGNPDDVAARAVELSHALTLTAGQLRNDFRALRQQQGADNNIPRWLSRLSTAERLKKG